MKLVNITVALCFLVAVGCKGGDAGTGANTGTTANQGQASGANPQAGGVTEADLGVPIYPGSSSENEGESKMVGSAKTTVSSVRTSPDSTDKIVQFYKDKLPKFEASKADDMNVFTGTGTNGGQVTIGIKKDGDHSEITIGNVKDN
jgi:hypothetical protein